MISQCIAKHLDGLKHVLQRDDGYLIRDIFVAGLNEVSDVRRYLDSVLGDIGISVCYVSHMELFQAVYSESSQFRDIAKTAILLFNLSNFSENDEQQVDCFARIFDESPLVSILTETPLASSHAWVSNFEIFSKKIGCPFSIISEVDDLSKADFRYVSILSGRLLNPKVNLKEISVAAVMHVYNEVDIIDETISYLLNNDLDVIVFDNWSDDGSFERVKKLAENSPRIRVERFPDVKGGDVYNWKEQLLMTEGFAQRSHYDWVLHYDADEIRTSFWANKNLKEAIAAVDSLGYNAIDFTVIDFVFFESQLYSTGLYQDDLTHFRFGKRPGHFKQVKAWKARGNQVDLSSTGGHEVFFSGRRIYPFKFLTRHYPLRSILQAEKKVFRDRKPRFEKEQQLYGWHGHYQHLKESNDIKFSEDDSLKWNGSSDFFSKFMIEALTGIGVSET